MLDRTIAPAFVEIPQITLQEAETFIVNNVPVHSLNSGQQDVIKIEAIFRAGKWHEKNNGVAYFTSKMLREGTSNRSSKQIADVFDQFGAHLEFTSTLDFAKVGLYCLTKHLEILFPILLEIIEEPQFPEDQLATIKEIEQQKLKIDLLKPRTKAQRKFRAVLFSNHPYGRPVTLEDMESIKREQLLGHHNDNYKNYEIFISGKFKTSEVKSLLEDLLPRHEGLNFDDTPYDLQYSREVYSDDIEGSMQTSIRMGSPFVGKQHPDYIPAQILNHVLGGYFGSRLMKNIREDKGYTYGIYSGITPLKHASYFSIATDVVKESSDNAVDEILKELKRLREEEIDLEELQTVKNHIAGSFQSDVTSPFSLMDKYKSVYLFDLDYSYYAEYFDMLASITATELKDLAIKYFDEKRISIIQVG